LIFTQIISIVVLFQEKTGVNSDFKCLRLKEAFKHLDKVTKQNGAPDIINEVETIRSFPTKGLCIGNMQAINSWV